MHFTLRRLLIAPDGRLNKHSMGRVHKEMRGGPSRGVQAPPLDVIEESLIMPPKRPLQRSLCVLSLIHHSLHDDC